MSGRIYSNFYWNHWFSDAGLRRSSFAARGLWMDMLCIAAQSDPIGYLAINKETLSVQDIARMVGGSEPEVSTLIEELARNGVLSRDRNGTIYSRRMVSDEKKAKENRKNGKKGGNPSLGNDKTNSGSVNPPDKGRVKPHKPIAISQEERKEDAAVPAHSDEVDYFRRGKLVCGNNSGGLLKNLLTAKQNNIPLARAAIEMAATKQSPREYVGAIIRGAEKEGEKQARYGVDWW